MSNLRIEGWLPRGGLGYTAIATAVGGFVLVYFMAVNTVNPKLGVAVNSILMCVTIWLSFGLRRDSEEGECYDEIMTEKEQSIFQFLSGDVRYSVFRISTFCMVAALLAVIVSLDSLR